MIAKYETLEEFYRHKFDYLPLNLQSDLGHYNVFRLEDCLKPGTKPMQYSRRDFYKITLIRGGNRYHYADKSIELTGSALLFFNPQVPYTWELLSDNTTGYFCIFSKSFFAGKPYAGLHELPLYQAGGKSAYLLSGQQEEQVERIFKKMLNEMESDYQFKYDLLRSYVTELTHLALKSSPTESLYHHPNAKTRITAVFTDLLERQFPIETPQQRFTMRSAQDFASQLAVHVNYLNRAIRETTGKTTTHLIAERLLSESKLLIRHTDWNIAEISYCLGFGEPAHFNNFFKKQTQLTPTAFRG